MGARIPLARRLLAALGGRSPPRWERERRDTLFLLGATPLSVLPHAAHLPWWCVSGFALLFCWRLGLVFSGRWLPRRSVRMLAAVAVLLAVWAQYRTLFGREPGVALLVLFLGLKLMEMQARRDLFVVIFLCLFLLVTAFFHSQSLATGAVALAAVLGLVAAMVTLQQGPRELGIGRRLRVAGTLLGQALPLAAILFVLFPRPAGPLWSLPDDAAGRSTGLSDTMTPGSILDLGLSKEIAFRVRFRGEPPPASTLYWRGPTMGLFDGRSWRIGNDAPVPAPAPKLWAPAGTPRVDYVLTLEPTERPWLFALERAPVAPAPDGGTLPTGLTPELQAVAARPIGERVRYRATALPDARIGLEETPLTLAGWLQLPPGFNRRTLELAARWRLETPRAGTAESRAEADPAADARLVRRALDLFREEGFRYTLSPPPLGRDTVDDFLFRTRAGFCEHYASAFVTLMRALDIPARVVTGYQGGERHPVDGTWTVRQADAHAWAEVWLAGRGWVRVDPTSAVAPERIERGTRLTDAPEAAAGGALADSLQRWRFGLEAVNHAWNQWMLGYDQGRQRRLLDRLGLPVDDWLELAGLAALALTLPVAAFALVTLHPRRPRDPLARAWARFCDRLALAGLERAPHETPRALLARIEGTESVAAAQRELARRIVLRYDTLRYDSPHPPSAEALRELRRLIDAFEP